MPPVTATLRSLKIFDHDYAYLDSEAPASTNYTTWVILHGLGFNAAVFEKLLPVAHVHNLRIVGVYRRGYAPSSGFKEDELEGIGKKFEEADPFFRGQGMEIAIFLARFATEHSIPLADPKTDFTGGIVLIGWSLASIRVLTVLAYANELPEDTQSTLRKYLHTILSRGETAFPSDCHCLFTTISHCYMRNLNFNPDASAFALGIPNPDTSRGDDLSPWTEADDRKRFNAFFDWVTAHYIHKSVTSEYIEDLNFNDSSRDIPRWLCELSDVERDKYTCLEAFAGCDRKLLSCDTTAFAELTKRALFDKGRAEILPYVRVRYMNGGSSGGPFIWTLWRHRSNMKNPGVFYGPNAEKVREVKLITQPGRNHLIFWGDSEKAIYQYNTTIKL